MQPPELLDFTQSYVPAVGSGTRGVQRAYNYEAGKRVAWEVKPSGQAVQEKAPPLPGQARTVIGKEALKRGTRNARDGYILGQRCRGGVRGHTLGKCPSEFIRKICC